MRKLGNGAIGLLEVSLAGLAMGIAPKFPPLYLPAGFLFLDSLDRLSDYFSRTIEYYDHKQPI